MYVQTLNNERKNVRIFIAADIEKADVSCKLVRPTREKSPGEREMVTSGKTLFISVFLP